MARDRPLYDLMLLLDADAPSERRAEILREVEGYVGNGGTIESKHDWGVRNLSYEIAHRKDAEYHLLQLTGPPELLDRLRAALKVTDGVLRHRIVRVRPGTPPPPVMRAAPRAADATPPEASPSEAAPSGDAPAAEAAPAGEAPAEEVRAEDAPAGEEPVAEAEPAPAEAPPAA